MQRLKKVTSVLINKKKNPSESPAQQDITSIINSLRTVCAKV